MLPDGCFVYVCVYMSVWLTSHYGRLGRRPPGVASFLLVCLWQAYVIYRQHDRIVSEAMRLSCDSNPVLSASHRASHTAFATIVLVKLTTFALLVLAQTHLEQLKHWLHGTKMICALSARSVCQSRNVLTY